MITQMKHLFCYIVLFIALSSLEYHDVIFLIEIQYKPNKLAPFPGHDLFIACSFIKENVLIVLRENYVNYMLVKL